MGRASVFIILLTVVLLAGVSCSKKEKPLAKKDVVIASAGLHNLYSSDFSRRYQMLKDFRQKKSFSADDIKQAVQKYFNEDMLFLAQAKEDSVQNEPIIKRRILKRKIDLLTYINGPLYKKIIPKEIPMSKKELQNLYDHLDYKIRVAIILVESKNLADSLYNIIHTGKESFGKVAQKYSRDLRTAAGGGLVTNYFTWGTFAEPFEKVAFNLEKEQVSRPVKTDTGYYIIMLLDKQPLKLLTFEEEQSRLKEKLRMVKTSRIVQKYFSDLLLVYQPKINKAAFNVIRRIYKDHKLSGDALKPAEHQIKAVSFKGGSWDLDDFVYFYNMLAAYDRIPIENNGDFDMISRKMLLPLFMYFEAVKLHLDKDASFRKNIRRSTDQILLNEIKQRLIYDLVNVSDEEVRQYYDEHPDKWPKQPFKSVEKYVRYRVEQNEAAKIKSQLLEALKKKFSFKYNDQAVEAVAKQLTEARKS